VTPNSNALLDLVSINKGLKLPILSLISTNNPSPLVQHVQGMLIYNTATAGTVPNNVASGLYINDGSRWIPLTQPGQLAGTVMYMASSNAPSGYLECDGRAVSRTTYSSLFSVIGTTYGVGDGTSTFNLPDLRGEFIRGWDHGRNIDSSRTIGSFQKGSFLSGGATPNIDSITSFEISGSTSMLTISSNMGWDYLNNTLITSSYPQAKLRNLSVASTTGSSQFSPNDSGSDYSFGVSRPRNIALMPIIKY
jgi:microcystin-dependent protein